MPGPGHGEGYEAGQADGRQAVRPYVLDPPAHGQTGHYEDGPGCPS